MAGYEHLRSIFWRCQRCREEGGVSTRRWRHSPYPCHAALYGCAGPLARSGSRYWVVPSAYHTVGGTYVPEYQGNPVFFGNYSPSPYNRIPHTDRLTLRYIREEVVPTLRRVHAPSWVPPGLRRFCRWPALALRYGGRPLRWFCCLLRDLITRSPQYLWILPQMSFQLWLFRVRNGYSFQPFAVLRPQ